MRTPPIAFWIGVVAFLLGSACAPKPTPTTTAPATSSPRPTTTAVPAAATVSTGDVAWQKVVEAARKEGKVTLYSYYLVGDTGLAVSRAFSAKYGIKLDIVTGRGAESTERLKTEQRTGQVTADILDTSATWIIGAKNQGLVALSSDLPVLQEKGVWVVDVKVYDPEGYVFRFSPTNSTIYINTKLVKPGDEPRSWFDLLNPRWKGKISVADPLLSSSTYMFIIPMYERKIFDEEFLRALGKQDLLFVTGNPEMVQKLSRGDYPLAAGLSESTAAKFVKEGAPVKALSLKEGVSGGSGGIAVIKNAPHPNAAKLYANWILSHEGNLVYSQANSVSSIRKDVPDFTPEGARVNLENVAPLTLKGALQTDEKFREKWLLELWKK